MNKYQIRRLIFYTIIAFMINVQFPEPYNSMKYYSFNLVPIFITLFVIGGGFALVSLEVD